MNVPAMRARGTTLVELVVVIVILSVTVGGVLLAVTDITRRSSDPLLLEQASAIAQAHLEEVLLAGFCDPDYDADASPATPLDCRADCTGPVCGSCRGSGATTEAGRALYDDVCDYDGLATSGVFDQTGTASPGLALYDVSIAVDDAGATLDTLSGAAGQSARVTVTVTHPDLPHPVVMSGYRANY